MLESLIGLLAIIAFILGLYAIMNYINYRIVRKFDNTVSYFEMLIPFWNIYLIDRTALGKPYAYYYFLGSLMFIIVLSKVTENYLHDNIIMLASNIINALLFATPMALIAQNLGKNLWVYWGLMVVPSVINIVINCIVTTIVMLVLAFDKSKPTSLPDGEKANHSIDKLG
ncbi:MAG: hypothetical protein K0Q77_1486 [Anaerosporomusa subterranea]|jgi:hypothetical protein|nr:hypothetical protein [Anaerosporomusa subterranea]